MPSGSKERRTTSPASARETPSDAIGAAEEIASAVLFAMANAFLTGQTLKVDGGEALS